MFGISFLDISGSMGLVATGALTVNFLIGILLSTGFKSSPYWHKLPPLLKKYPLLQVHNFTAYTALFFVLLHITFLFLHKQSGFSPIHLINPLSAPKQAWVVVLGVLSLYAFLGILLSSQDFIRKKLGYRLWKNIHLSSYCTALLFLIHGLLMDPLLKDRPTDWLDAEKFFSEACIIVLLSASFIRFRFYLKYKR
jgi:methionine sulfoxide reductase heme-binding subunit